MTLHILTYVHDSTILSFVLSKSSSEYSSLFVSDHFAFPNSNNDINYQISILEQLQSFKRDSGSLEKGLSQERRNHLKLEGETGQDTSTALFSLKETGMFEK